jgi:hypothetical protein
MSNNEITTEYNVVRPNNEVCFNTGALVMQELLERANDIETKPGRLPAEFIEAREDCWVAQTGPAWVGCGDDREATAMSAQELIHTAPEITPANEAYASIFGGIEGVAKNILIVGSIQYPDFTKQVGGMNGITDKLIRFAKDNRSTTALSYTLHSAEGNENPDGTFCAHGNSPVGCAYCGGVGATSALLTDESDSLIRDVAREDQVEIFGSDEGVDALLDAHRAFLVEGTDGKGGDYAVGREDYVELTKKGVPVMILAGQHTAAKNTGLVHNFEPSTLGSSQKAAAGDKRFYREDVAAVTADILTIFREYNLNPDLLLRSFVLDSTPVRAVLAAHDSDPELNGKLDPRNLAMGWRGDPRKALEGLRQTA